jgi:hypothetical protein
MTTILVSDMPAGQTLDMPCNNLLTTIMHTVDASTIAGGNVAVTRVLFVDAGASATGATGSLSHPFLTINAAILAAAALAVDSIIIKIAPGDYAELVVVGTSDLLCVSFDGWTSAGPEAPNTNLPVLSGGMVIFPATGGPATPDIFISNAYCTGTIGGYMSSDIQIHMHNAHSIGSIEGATLNLYATVSNIAGIVGGSDDTNLYIDGYTWGRLVANNTSLAPATKFFYDHGCDMASSALNVTGLAIGSSQEVAFPHPITRNNEFAIITKIGTAQTDYTLTFSHTETAAVHAIITNLSRMVGDFSDPVSTLVFHREIPSLPPP